MDTIVPGSEEVHNLVTGAAPHDRPDDELYYFTYRGVIIRRQPNEGEHGLTGEELANVRQLYAAGRDHPSEVARRKRRKRPEGDADNQRRVEQRQADQRQQAVNLGVRLITPAL